MKLVLAVLYLFMLLINSIFIASSQKFNDEIDKLFRSQFKPDQPGGSVLIKKGKNIKFMKSYGIANLKTGEKVTENTVFNVGSISKTFVSNGILILSEQNSLSLHDPLSKFFPDFKNRSISDSVTIQHLLTHTSGLPDIRNVRNNYAFYLTAKDEENFNPIKQADYLVFEAGSQFQYSNPAFNGLALVIEKISKEPWQNFIKKNIFLPANMLNSTITNGAHPITDVAHAYYKNEKANFIEFDYGEVPTFAAAGNGGVWSTILDLAKYEEALQKNVFLSDTLFQKSREVFYPENWKSSSNAKIGYSWFISKKTMFDYNHDFNVEFVYHTGSQGGFRSFYISIPEKEILFIGLFNRPLDNYKKNVMDALLILEKYYW